MEPIAVGVQVMPSTDAVAASEYPLLVVML